MRISPSSAVRPLVAFVVVISLLCLQSSASAGWLASTPHAYDDGFGPTLGVWQGSHAYSRTAPAGPNAITGTLEYAVFAPGAFQAFLNDHFGGPPPFDPAPGEVVYAYQLLDVTVANPGVTKISVGLDAIDIPGTISPPSWIPTGAINEQLPDSGEYIANTSMVWNFPDLAGTVGVNERLLVGEQSPILFFSSEYLPELDNITVTSGIAGPHYVDAVPSIGTNLSSEIPEPSSLAILLIAAASSLGFIRRRSR